MKKPGIVSKGDNLAIDRNVKTFNALDEVYNKTKNEDVIVAVSIMQYEISQDIDNILARNIIH